MVRKLLHRRRSVSMRCPLAGERLSARELLAGDLIAAWRAEDLATTLQDGQVVTAWTDSTGGVNAIGKGQPKWQAGVIGGRAAIQFDPTDGVDQLLVDRLANPLSQKGDFTISLVYATASTTLTGQDGAWFTNTAIIDASSLGFANDWGIAINHEGQLAAGLGFGFGVAPLTLRTEQGGWHDGTWHQVIFQRNGSTLRLQIDDQPAIVATNGHANPLAILDLSFGSQKFGDLPWSGQIAELKIYDGALESDALRDLRSETIAFYNNAPPTAVPDSYRLTEDPTLFFQTAETGVLANDLDAEGDVLRAVLVRDVSHGKLSLRPDGSFLYDPQRDFFGIDTFEYQAVDLQGSAPVTVTLVVDPVRDGPIAINDQYLTEPLQVLRVSATDGLLQNDRNPDRANLQVVLERDVAAGRLEVNSDGSFTYDPQGFAGVVSFTYALDDGQGRSAAATVELIVNTPPMAADDHYTLSEDSQLIVPADRGILANDRDADMDLLTWTLVEGPHHGTLDLDQDGGFRYVPDAEYFGEDTFTYRITDGRADSAVAIVSIQITAINDAPAALADEYVGLPNKALTIPAQRGVLANDMDVDNVALQAEAWTFPQSGALQLASDGGLRYEPRPGFEGMDSFQYRAFDGETWSEPMTVSLTITSTPLVISEFLAINGTTMPTRIWHEPTQAWIPSPLTPDWIELHNATSSSLSLANYFLTDRADQLQRWAFPEDAVIGPQAHLIVYASGLDIRDLAKDEQGRYHTNFSLSGDGGFLALSHLSGKILSSYGPHYPPQRVDVSFGLAGESGMYATPPTPGTAGTFAVAGLTERPSFNRPHGFYSTAIEVEISTTAPGATLVYTLDGSDPTQTNGIVAPPPAPHLPPSVLVPVDRTTTLRAMAFADDRLSSEIVTASYLFVADIREQTVFSNTIKNSPIWAPQLEASLLSLPTVSLVSGRRISEAETETSLELIFPDGTPGFQLNAGVEHYGGHSLSSPKKNMRLSFKSIYGTSSLKYDLFGDGATQEFEQLLLRTGSHDTFFWTHPDGGRGNYLRNRWAFDRQLEMGQLAPHGRFVHVYINGRYWGMHHLMERPNADFMAAYEGGESYDYEAINAGVAIDGDTQTWRSLQRNDVIDNYETVARRVDLENYADYMLLQFYGGNDWDWNAEQNWMAARKRSDDGGFVFFAWDSDVLLRTTANANVISRGGPSNLWNAQGGIKQHPEFLMLLADRAQRYFFDEGMFTDERLRADFTRLAEQIRLPMIAESGRWGGTGYTPTVWEGAVDWMLNRFAPVGPNSRAATVIEQMRRARVFPSIDAPYFSVNGIRQGNSVQLTRHDLLTLGADQGEIFYTLNGEDPRLPGGDRNPAALQDLGATWDVSGVVRVKARALLNGEWSALREVTLQIATVAASALNLTITEVHYHPASPTPDELAAGFTDADEFEFLEIKNIADTTVVLDGLRFEQQNTGGTVQGIAFAFGDNHVTFLAPGERLVVVENLDAFRFRYGEQPQVAGQWSGGLGNREELLTLRGADGQLVRQFAYRDSWHPSTDGQGHSLQLVDENRSAAEQGQAAGDWRASHQIAGSPGTADGFAAGDANGDGVFDSLDLVLAAMAGEFEDGISRNSTWEEGDWDGDGDFTTRDLVFAFQRGGYRISP